MHARRKDEHSCRPRFFWPRASFLPAAAYIDRRRPAMSKPLVVSIPHRLGKAEAVRRLKTGLASAQSDSGMIDVREDHVMMELQLPWLLHQIVEKAQGLIGKRGQLLLEKK